MPRSRLLRLVPALLLVVLGLAACGSSDDPEQADATLTQPPLTSTQETPPRVTVPTVTTPPATTTATTPAPPPETTPATPPDNGGTPTATQPATPPEDTGGAQAPAQDDPPAQTTPEQSGGTATPQDCGQAIGGFIKGIAASGADCGAATGVASAWYEAINQGSAPDAAIDAAGYTCSGSMSGQRTAVTCSGAAGEQVTFSASP